MVPERADGAGDGAEPAPAADADLDAAALDDAAAVVRRGDLVVYPTETVYGLGALATDPEAVARVFAAKGRDRDRPVSLAVPDVDAATDYVDFTDRERAFVDDFLPGPVTVVCRRRPAVPDVLTAGRDRVGLRVPDHPGALALLERVAPLTATSANRSGTGSVRDPTALSTSLREAVAAVLDAGRTPGGESTVVDVSAGELIRRGRRADAVADWLAAHP